MTNAQVHRQHIEKYRRAMQEADPAMKRLERLERTIKRHRVRSYEGFSINRPNVGDVLMHFRHGDGPRVSIRINLFGAIHRDGTVYQTAREIMEAA